MLLPDTPSLHRCFRCFPQTYYLFYFFNLLSACIPNFSEPNSFLYPSFLSQLVTPYNLSSAHRSSTFFSPYFGISKMGLW